MRKNFLSAIYGKFNAVKIVFVLVFTMLLSFNAKAQVTVAGAHASSNGTYSTLAAAFAAINGQTQTGFNITVSITANTNEGTGAATLNAGAWTTLTISPSGGGARTISGNRTAGNPMIDINGADNVTIDGLNTGGNSLTIENTTASASGGTSTIRFQTDATNNTITNCTILGSASMAVGTTGGNIWFGSAAVSTGNDNNTISNCNLGPSGSNLPSKLIAFTGTSNTDPGTANSGIIIRNNNFYDFFQASVNTSAIDIGSGTVGTTIEYNRFYQTASRTQVSTTINHRPIFISNTSGNAYTIRGNVIGRAVYTSASGASSSGTTVTVASTDNLAVGMRVGVSAGTGTFAANTYVTAINSSTTFTVSTAPSVALSGATVTGNATTEISNYPASAYTYVFPSSATSGVFAPIFVSVGTTTATSVQANTISGIAISGVKSGTTTSSIFIGIFVSAGLTTIADVAGNRIGSMTAIDDITVTSSSTLNGETYGIFNNGTSAWTTNNNQIGGITVSNSSSGATLFFGLRANTATGVSWTCTGNTIGGNIANSINNTNTATTSLVNGITASLPGSTITSNLVRNLTQQGVRELVLVHL